jgi:3'-phosphoadenosine 5'-phosphosulfate sulfotransferase (PAPS reductase)/FAD synthetase
MSPLQAALSSIAAEFSPVSLASSLSLEDMVITDAIARDAFYQDPELRMRCCAIRKIEPLARVLADKRAWITGQPREHLRAGRWWWEDDGHRECGLHLAAKKKIKVVA